MQIARLALCGALALTLLCGSANAVVVNVSVTGKVTSGTDTGGVFSPAGTNLANEDFTAFYQFDTSLGFDSDGALYTDIFGIGANSPSLGAVMTIRGQQVSFPGDYEGQVQHVLNYYAFYYAESDHPTLEFVLYTYLETNSNPPLPFPFDIVPYSVVNPDTSDGIFMIRALGYTDVLQLQPTAVTLEYASVAAVPIPGVGVGAAGIALLCGTFLSWRRRRNIRSR
jgi:hypothetical protein